MKLTKKVKEKYLKNPVKCPYCNSYNIQVIFPLHLEGRNVYTDMICPHCKNKWKEIFKLSNIEEIEEKDCGFF